MLDEIIRLVKECEDFKSKGESRFREEEKELMTYSKIAHLVTGFKTTEQYESIMDAIREVQDYHIKCIFVRNNGETQEKDIRFAWMQNDYLHEWIEDVLDAYWVKDEVIVYLEINGVPIYWEHPQLCTDEHREMLNGLRW